MPTTQPRENRRLAGAARTILPPLGGAGALLRRNAVAVSCLFIACLAALVVTRYGADRWLIAAENDISWHMGPSLFKWLDKQPPAPPDQIYSSAQVDSALGRAIAIYELMRCAALALAVLTLCLGVVRLLIRSPLRLPAIGIVVLAAGILFAPALVFHVSAVIRDALGHFPWPLDPSEPRPPTWRDGVAALWFIIGAPFLLPVLAIAPETPAPLTEAARIGWVRYQSFAVAAGLTTLPFAAIIMILDWVARSPVQWYFRMQFPFCWSLAEQPFDAGLALLTLLSALMTTAAFVALIRPPTSPIAARSWW